MTITSVGPGWCEVELEVTDELLNPFGAAHGAVAASIVDHALGTAVFPLLPLGTWPATLEFKLNYLAPVRPGVLRARAEVVSISARTAVVTVECTNRDRVAATALGTIAITPAEAALTDILGPCRTRSTSSRSTRRRCRSPTRSAATATPTTAATSTPTTAPVRCSSSPGSASTRTSG